MKTLKIACATAFGKKLDQSLKETPGCDGLPLSAYWKSIEDPYGTGINGDEYGLEIQPAEGLKLMGVCLLQEIKSKKLYIGVVWPAGEEPRKNSELPWINRLHDHSWTCENKGETSFYQEPPVWKHLDAFTELYEKRFFVRMAKTPKELIVEAAQPMIEMLKAFDSLLREINDKDLPEARAKGKFGLSQVDG